MDAVLRAAAVYIFLLLLFRLSGKRMLAQITAFDFVLLLVISEATQQALLGRDYSITGAALVITTLVWGWTSACRASSSVSRAWTGSSRTCR